MPTKMQNCGDSGKHNQTQQISTQKPPEKLEVNAMNVRSLLNLKNHMCSFRNGRFCLEAVHIKLLNVNFALFKVFCDIKIATLM